MHILMEFAAPGIRTLEKHTQANISKLGSVSSTYGLGDEVDKQFRFIV